MVRSFMRGWPIVYIDGDWVYADTKTSTAENRPCKRCGVPSTTKGHDACLGTVQGALWACCGHGVERGFILRR